MQFEEEKFFLKTEPLLLQILKILKVKINISIIKSDDEYLKHHNVRIKFTINKTIPIKNPTNKIISKTFA